MNGNNERKMVGALIAMIYVLLPVVVFAVETDRITVEDPSTQAIKFKVTSDGNVTGASFIGAAMNGASISIQQAVGETATNKKISIKNSSGTVLSAFQANGSLGIGTTSPATKLHVTVPGGGTTIYSEGFNASSVAGPTISCRAARGTPAAPSATQAGDMLGAINFRGYGATGWAGTSRAAVFGYAEENYTDSAQGTYLTFETTAPGATLKTIKATFTGSGNLGIGTVNPSQKLEVNGGVRLNTVTSQPDCSNSTPTTRGTFWVTQGATDDVVQVCVMAGSVLGWKTVQVQ